MYIHRERCAPPITKSATQMMMKVLVVLWVLFPSILCRFDIDVVYTWVQQPNRTKYEVIRQICPDSHGNNIQRFRDTGTLYHSIRSVLTFLPWIRHIFLVTNGERPCWLQETNKLSIVSHDEIWPTAQRESELPTFNSIPIEAHIHRIQGLSEHFIYLNDDMFIGKYLPPSYFFDLRSGVPHVNVKDFFWLPYELLAEENFIWGREPSYSLNTTPGYILTQLHYPTSRTAPRPFPGAYMGTHGPYMSTISLINQIQSLWPRYFQHLSSQRCRSATNTQPVYSAGHSNTSHPPYRPPFWIYQWYQIVSNISLPIERNVPFLNMFHLPSTFYESLLSSKSTVEFFILNDDYSVNPLKGDIDIKRQQLFLEQYYGWNSLNDFLPLEDRLRQKKLFDSVGCNLIKDQSYFSIIQKRKYFLEEKDRIRKTFQVNYSDSFAVTRYRKVMKDLYEDTREVDHLLLASGNQLSSSNKSFYQLTLNSLIFPSPLQVGHYSDYRDGLLSGPFSYEGMNSLVTTQISPETINLNLSLQIVDGSKQKWQINCDIIRQSNYSRSGVFSLIRNLLPTVQDHVSSLHSLADCLHLNYLLGVHSEVSIRNRKLGLVEYEWGILSSFPLRDMRRYEFEYIFEDMGNARFQFPVVVASIPVSMGSPPVYSPPDWNESLYNSSEFKTISETQRKSSWIDIWCLLPSLMINAQLNQTRRRMNKRLQTPKQLKMDLLDAIKIRGRKKPTLGSIVLGVVDDPIREPVETLWSVIKKVFHSDRYDGFCSTNKSPHILICGNISDIFYSNTKDQLVFPRQIVDILLKLRVNK